MRPILQRAPEFVQAKLVSALQVVSCVLANRGACAVMSKHRVTFTRKGSGCLFLSRWQRVSLRLRRPACRRALQEIEQTLFLRGLPASCGRAVRTRDVNVQLQPPGPDDQCFLEQLFYVVRAPEFAPLDLPPAMLGQLLHLQFRAQTQSYAADFPHAQDSIVRVEGERAGRLLVYRAGGEIHLLDIALMERYRRCGIGARLIRGLCAEAGATCRFCSLSVRAGNPAEALYRRLGFLPAGGDGVYRKMVWKAGNALGK